LQKCLLFKKSSAPVRYGSLADIPAGSGDVC
jgi:hypothetical protein